MRRVVFSRASEADLASIIRDIGRSSPRAALDFARSLKKYCLSLGDDPHRGREWDEIASGLRTIGYDRRATIAFRVEPDRVTIVRILYRGRNVAGALHDSRD